MALSNDISAATAGAMVAQAQPAQPAASVEQRLQALDALRTKGLITDAEYATRRQQLISEV